MKTRRLRGPALLTGALVMGGLIPGSLVLAEISATHIYHNHMPNFWAYFDTSDYPAMSVGTPIRYMYDAQVIELKENPPADYPYYLPNGQPMPHDDIASYYSHHAKQGAYMYWPIDTASANNSRYPMSQTQVTMSAAVINNVQSLNELQNVSGYNNPNWGDYWVYGYDTFYTTHGYHALEPIHFTGHHSMGPLVGDEYFLKDMIYNNITQAQDYFLGDSFRSSKGFFPTELGFSVRLIPMLKKLGIEWSAVGDVHFSRTLVDYPYLNDPGKDCMISPPNRADLQNSSNVGEWVSLQMYNEQQVTQNKFPYAVIPHWVRYVDPTTGSDQRIVAIPAEQAKSWEEGYLCKVTADVLKPYQDEASSLNRVQYFVIAHDGDNSSGCAGDSNTWMNSGNVTYADSEVGAKGVREYLNAYPVPASDLQHIQDGSWIDTRDSSSDPTWYHWHLPFCVWKDQFSAFNEANGTSYAPKTNYAGQVEGMTVSLEYGYHYLERNFALLQAAMNYAKTAEQIWLDDHPNYWSPTTAMDREVTYSGNQLNPWMMSYPVKGNVNSDYAGGANPAELAWYFLLPAMDSGFGYYDENQDDSVKPTLSFNQSLYFSTPYVDANLVEDRTGPSVWWPQRWPYNPGSANKSKAEGWTLHYFDNTFAIYTYAYDVNDIADIKLKVRVHTNKQIDPQDKTPLVYDPVALEADPQVDSSRVGAWVSYSMKVRDLTDDMNGVDWQPSTTEIFEILPAQKIGDLYYTYLSSYRDQLLDYYIEATDYRGNVTKTAIQHVYVGQGRYTTDASGKIVESATGTMVGTYPFVTDKVPSVPVTVYMQSSSSTVTSIQVQSRLPGESWGTALTLSPVSPSSRYYMTSFSYPGDGTGIEVRYTENGTRYIPSSNGTLLTTGTWTISYDGTVKSGAPSDLQLSATVYYYSYWGDSTYMHYRPVPGNWTTVPGVKMQASGYTGYYVLTVNLGTSTQLEACFNNGSGTWDNNGSKNYLFSSGIWSLKDGKITAGTPSGTPGNLPPVADAGDDIEVLVGDTVTFDGSGSYDSDGSIVTYAWSNGLSGVRPTKVYTATGTYTVTLTVTDDDGSTATDSVTVTVRDGTERLVTVYYKRGYSTPYIHYRQDNGVWTTAPGYLMPQSECTGYNIAEDISIGSYDYLECVFTDGQGHWDNNNGQNYRFPEGVWTYDAGKMTAGAPCLAPTPTPEPTPVLVAPVAVITPETATVKVGDEITLDGSDSYDDDGVITSYLWSNGKTTDAITVFFDEPGTYQVTLTVTDLQGLTDMATATITVEDNGGGCPQGGQPSTRSGLGFGLVLLVPALAMRRRVARTQGKS